MAIVTKKLKRFWSTSRDKLEHMYNSGLSHRLMALKFKVSETAVCNLFKKLNIKNRTIAESQTVTNTRRIKKLTYMQEQLLLGSLLGDACLSFERYKSRWTGRELTCYKLNFAHTEKHIGYLNFKKKLLGNGIKGPLKTGLRISGHGSRMRFFSFSHTPILRVYSEICHDEHHKKALTKEWLNKIDWPAIAFWYQDDGSLRLRKNGQKSIDFHTESFKPNEISMLRELLLKFGLQTTLGYNNGSKDQQIIIANRQGQIKEFFNKIRPYVVPCMRYKLRDSGLIRNKLI